jgi:pectate lyase
MVPRATERRGQTVFIALALILVGAAGCLPPAEVAALPPSISSFSPTSGGAGTEVTVSGQNFDPVVANDAVKFNGQTAEVKRASPTSLSVVVPSGATSGPIAVTVAGLTATSSDFFSILGATGEAPSISQAPEGVEAPLDGRATFSVAATGTPPLSYQWALEGRALPGEQGASLTRSPVSATHVGTYSVTVSNAFGFVVSPGATLTLTTAGAGPVITSPPASLSVVAGDDATFTVVATGTGTLSYQWKREGQPIAGATEGRYTIVGTTLADAASYTVTVTDSVSSVTSASATLTVSSTTPSLSSFSLTGFGAATTGGGVVAESDPAYRQCRTALELATAVRDANKTQGAVKVIEIMNDLDLGWNEVGASVQGLSGTPFRAHNAPKLHPVLLASGVSIIDVKAKGGGLTIFSANGATLRHAMLNVKSTSNIIIRNLKFDELWEWDEATKGKYDSNDWDFIDLGNGGTVSDVWIDHCTFTKSYDGIVDIKGGSHGITFSWNRYVGDDEATNASSFVRRQLAVLEASKSSYPMYNFFRSNGFSVDDLAALHRGHDKTHLIGGTEFDSANAAFSVTFHHQWYQNTWDRHPRLRAGQVHAYNTLVDATEELTALRKRDALVAAMSAGNQSTANNTYSLRPPLNGTISTEGGAILVEKSVYLDCLWPLRNNQTDPSDSTYTGKVLARDTISTFHDADGTVTTIRGDSTDPGSPLGPSQAAVVPFSWNTFSTLPYAYTLDDPSQLAVLLQSGAGAGVMSWTKAQWLKTTY